MADVTLLHDIPLFSVLTASERGELARAVTSRHVEAGKVLFWMGDGGADFFIIRHGKIAIVCPDASGRELPLAILGTGDFLGELSLLDGGPRTATARALVDSHLLCIGRDDFHKFIRACPSSAIHMMTVLGQRQRQTVERLRGIRNLNEVMEQRLTAWQRVANVIAAMACSEQFLIGHAVVFTGWIILNLLMGRAGPDPYPFPFLCFWSSTEAIFLSLFIMFSQNVQSQKDRLRTELEYQVALKAQVEIMGLHQKLDLLIARGESASEPDEIASATDA